MEILAIIGVVVFGAVLVAQAVSLVRDLRVDWRRRQIRRAETLAAQRIEFLTWHTLQRMRDAARAEVRRDLRGGGAR